MRQKLIIKMMKYGIPGLGAKMIVDELSEEQVLSAYMSYDYLQDIIKILYYEKQSHPNVSTN